MHPTYVEMLYSAKLFTCGCVLLLFATACATSPYAYDPYFYINTQPEEQPDWLRSVPPGTAIGTSGEHQNGATGQFALASERARMELALAKGGAVYENDLNITEHGDEHTNNMQYQQKTSVKMLPTKVMADVLASWYQPQTRTLYVLVGKSGEKP